MRKLGGNFGRDEEARTANTGLAKVAVQCSADTFVVKIATFAKPQNVISKAMQTPKPNYNDLGLSSPMGPQLRKLVETQLLTDLVNYGQPNDNLKFDWSDSCIEGHDTSYLGTP